LKKIIVFLMLCVGLLAVEKHKNVYLEIEKETNGGYFLMLPCVETVEKFEKYTEYTKLSLNFTAERGELTMQNHHSISLEKTFEIEIYKGFYTSFSLGTDYFLEENSDKIEEGFQFNNKLRIGYKN
jgi:hypothetical protein